MRMIAGALVGAALVGGFLWLSSSFVLWGFQDVAEWSELARALWLAATCLAALFGAAVMEIKS